MPEIKIEDIIVDEKFNSRDKIDPINIKSLADDIEENGLINPVTLMEMEDGKYKLIAGFSRFFAFRALGRETIPATILAAMDEIAQRSVNLRENLCRKNLSLSEEAKALTPFFDAGLSDQRIMKKLGVSRGFVQERRYFLALPEDIRKEIIEGKRLVQSEIRPLYSFLKKEGVVAMYAAARKFITNRAKGGGVPPKISRKGGTKRIRKRPEMFALQERIFNIIGKSCLATRVLGWCAGELNDEEFETDLKSLCERQGLNYTPPAE